MRKAAKQVATTTPSTIELQFGERIRQWRRERGHTLEEVSAMTGIGASTLSKIETGRSGASFTTLIRLSRGLNLSVDELTGAVPNSLPGLRTSTLRGQGAHVENAQYSYELLSGDITRKLLFPCLIRVKARSIDEFDTWNLHAGEEFAYVLSGVVWLYYEGYKPSCFRAGDSFQYDSGVPHAFVGEGQEDPVVMSVSYDASGSGNQAGDDRARSQPHVIPR
ncbi:transcriptional regulator, XRE family with cupin sensor [Rhizobiales bacterium GAS191]|nr:transcriptional regulator, XRE family with cupin sensor [Rhizobiales bacterium GAS191]